MDVLFFSSKLSTEAKQTIAKEDKAIMTAITAAHHFFDDPVERRAYFAEEIRRMDEQSLIEGNRREAKEEGIAEGEAKAEERLVLNLLKHVDLMDAAFMLNLDVDKVRSIAKKFGLRH